MLFYRNVNEKIASQ